MFLQACHEAVMRQQELLGPLSADSGYYLGVSKTDGLNA